MGNIDEQYQEHLKGLAYSHVEEAIHYAAIQLSHEEVMEMLNYMRRRFALYGSVKETNNGADL